MTLAIYHDALSALSAENKSCFDHAYDGQSFCLPKHISWNRFLRHLLKLGNDRGATIHSVLLSGISHHHSKRRQRKNKEQFLHRVSLLRQFLSQPQDITAIYVVIPSDILMTRILSLNG